MNAWPDHGIWQCVWCNTGALKRNEQRKNLSAAQRCQPLSVKSVTYDSGCAGLRMDTGSDHSADLWEQTLVSCWGQCRAVPMTEHPQVISKTIRFT